MRYLVSLLFVLTVCQAAFAKNLYVDASGADSNDGLSAERPVRTLARAHQILLAGEKPSGDVSIVVAPGTYLDQRIVWKIADPSYTIRIIGNRADPTTTIFDGGGAGAFFKLDAAGGTPSKIEISGLTIRRYQTAISINGNRNRKDGWNGSNTISHNRFIDIGSVRDDQRPSTAALRLVHSKNNTVIRNQFINVRNINRCGQIHAIYMAHGSSGNTIRDNLFDGSCGIPIKVRDSSNENRIVSNSFSDMSVRALMADSYCNRSKGSDCTKKGDECPSWDNSFYDNSYLGTMETAPRFFQVYHKQDHPAGCEIGKSRIVGSNNRVTDSDRVRSKLPSKDAR